MKYAIIFLNNGETIGTRINGTDEEISEYYKVGSVINIGNVDDRMVKIVKVDIRKID